MLHQRTRGRRSRRRTVAAITGVLAVAGVIQVAAAGPASATVSARPAAWTPQITSSDATVRQLVQCGTTMYAVGAFSTVKQDGTTFTRHNAFSFNATTGAVTSWNPSPSAEVNSVALNGTCSVAYLGGGFSTVSGAAARGIAAVSTATGRLETGFAHDSAGAVNTIAMVDSGREVMVGGNFTAINGTARPYYVSMNPTTGKVDSYFTAAVAGRYGGDSGPTKIYNQQVSPRGDKLLFEGIFTSIGGVAHQQMAELDLSGTRATVDPWSNATMNSTSCTDSEVFYLRAGAFSPDENTIYGAATGYRGSSPFCDAVTAFANTASAPVIWRNLTGGDSLYSVAAGPHDVYVGGHERWANNPLGSDSCGPGCVSRPGLGDISASSGLATSWNPTRGRGHGADDLLITPAGLWVASDTYFDSVLCGGAYHPGICFFPGTA